AASAAGLADKNAEAVAQPAVPGDDGEPAATQQADGDGEVVALRARLEDERLRPAELEAREAMARFERDIVTGSGPVAAGSLLGLKGGGFMMSQATVQLNDEGFAEKEEGDGAAALAATVAAAVEAAAEAAMTEAAALRQALAAAVAEGEEVAAQHGSALAELTAERDAALAAAVAASAATAAATEGDRQSK
ncbi:unnamed protein product, partial [Phaeothamnion confervicola]